MKKIYFSFFVLANIYAYSQCTPRALPFTEDFSGTPLAACAPASGGWVGTTVASGAGWWVPSPSTNYAGGAAPEIEAYGDQANGGVTETITLTSPPINTGSVGSYTVSFKHSLYLHNSGASGSGSVTLKVETSPDNVNWSQEWTNSYTATSSLTQVVGETRSFVTSNVSAASYLRFTVSGVLFKVWGWEIDDVNVSSSGGTTGIASGLSNISLIAPNPFSDKLIVNCEAGTLISIVDLLGKEVYSQRATQTQTQIDAKNLPAGMYVVRTNGPAGSGSLKVIKN